MQTKFDERHWSQKPLDEMNERDWRIFREDYNIQTRGGNIPHPFRTWSEAELMPELSRIIDSLGFKVRYPLLWWAHLYLC